MRQRILLTVLAALVGVLLLAIVSFGQGTYHGDWHTVGGGGGVSEGSTFTVRGTAGRPDADTSSGVTYTVRGSFWPGVRVIPLFNTNQADLSIVKACLASPGANPGEVATYTLTVSNRGPQVASGVRVTDHIPVSVTHASLVVDSSLAITASGSISSVWEVEPLSAGKGGVITITGVLSDSLDPGVFSNTATITSAALDGEPSNNSSTAWLVVGEVTNQPPEANAGEDQTIGTNALVTVNGSRSSDPDGHLPLTYRWAQTGGPVVTFTEALSVTSFTAPGDPAMLTLTLTVTDALGLPSAPDEVVIAVTHYHVYLPIVLRATP